MNFKDKSIPADIIQQIKSIPPETLEARGVITPAKTKAVSVEIGMQNSGLAAGLASKAFSTMPEAAIPGAMFSVWHNISGAVLAGIYRHWNTKK